ncbi:hypothetical protein A2U01_0084053, partial [Trifolium medium]|nr:hypothetical protein [Trifolium medium]
VVEGVEVEGMEATVAEDMDAMKDTVEAGVEEGVVAVEGVEVAVVAVEDVEEVVEDVEEAASWLVNIQP